MIDQIGRVDPDGGSYRGLHQWHKYTNVRGLIVLPVASTDSQHVVIRLHGGYGTRTVRWDHRRLGMPPMIPAAADTDGDTILSETVMPHLPQHNPQNHQYDWRVEGEYTYVQNSTRIAGQNAFPAGNHPYLVLPQANAAQSVVAVLSETDLNTVPNPADYITETAIANLPTADNADGTMQWPLTMLPAALTSTHIIGG